ncbi:unnamed protein product [Acanthoscelides obtectus]|uniref:Uncharacterized protein n=1 Tax=Acanthoscelides obtectus TaxID=200917 RepID=A0A9P0P9P3_ACAOB|nr:unnamed protein product [Acanthoscelides obtectus]CAK1654686.1 hypothetical protein AOBTE_LOCUS18770 [Acanthoscelides obtectus]
MFFLTSVTADERNQVFGDLPKRMILQQDTAICRNQLYANAFLARQGKQLFTGL